MITKDNAEVLGSVSLNYHVTEPVKYQYENTDSVMSMVQLVRGHLRDIIGRMDLNEVLGSTKEINKELADAIGDLTDIYGINVDRINIDELTPSKAIQEAMNTQLQLIVNAKLKSHVLKGMPSQSNYVLKHKMKH
ncbi:hypothetical protein AKUH4B205J_01660 [Apilactobacillus kunkeei]|nr:hypothetical protein AKUH4B205J_01660 [Apilactobacillus kunkeei]